MPFLPRSPSLISWCSSLLLSASADVRSFDDVIAWAGLDFIQVAQGANGGWDGRPHNSGWIGAPDRRNASGCLEGYGHQGVSGAYYIIKDVVEEALPATMAELLDADDTGRKTVPRRQVWAKLLAGSRDYLQSRYGRGHAPNQDLADQLAATFANVGLGKLSPDKQLPREQMLTFAYQAIGILPAPNEGPGWGWWFSSQGISMEPNTDVNGGYSHGYGDEEWALGTLAMLLNDTKVLQVANTHVTNFAKFRSVDNTRSVDFNSGAASVSLTCRVESVVTWRHNKNPGSITYGGGDFGAYMTLVAKNPVSIRLAQLKIAHGAVYKYDIAAPAAAESPHWADSLARAAIELESFAAVAALPPTEAKLPGEEGAPDFAFADVQAAVVALKNGRDKMYVSLQWRHGYIDSKAPRIPSNAALNNVARVHFTQAGGGDDGAGARGGGSKSIDRIMNIAMQPQAGENQGWRKLYATPTIGRYTIAMNLHSEDLVWTPPAALVGRAATDLIRGHVHSSVGKTIQLPAQSTIVLYTAELN